MAKLFSASNDAPHTEIVRIQHKDHGFGPYTTDNEAVNAIMEGSGLPSPQQSLGFDESDISHLEDVNIPKKFGFLNEEMMHQSISKDQLKALKEHGFEPVKIKAAHVWGNNKQIYYSTAEQHAERQKQIDAATIPKDDPVKKTLSRLQELLQKAKDIKTVVRRKVGEKTAMTRGERRQAAKEKEVADKLKDPDFRAKALMANVKEHANERIKVRDKDKAYDDAVATDDGDAQPVATKKRTGAFVAQFNRRKNANDRKLINKETKEKMNKSDLEKGMNNSGLGGAGSIKAGAVKPSISKMPKPSNNSSTPSINLPPASKKNAIKQAQQIQSKDIKDIRMKEAQDMVKFEKNGQWSLEKRCWEGYEPTPGKKAYEEDSCRPTKKADIEIAPEGSKNRESYKDEFKKKEDKPFHGYNKDKHSKEGGMSAKARKKHNNETGSNLQKPVTSKEAKGSDKKAGRRNSFCARMGGVSGPTSKDGKLTRKGAALQRWDCSKSESMELQKNGQWSMVKADDTVEFRDHEKNPAKSYLKDAKEAVKRKDATRAKRSVEEAKRVLGTKSSLKLIRGGKEDKSPPAKDLEFPTENIKLAKSGQWTLETLEKTAKGRAQNDAIDYRTSADEVAADDNYSPKEKRKFELQAFDAERDADDERSKADRTQATANKKIQARKERNRPGKTLENLRDKFHGIKQQIKKMESATSMSYDDSSDKVVNGATVNQAAHQGADVNIANKQPSEVIKGAWDDRDYSKGGKDEANMAERKKNNMGGTGVKGMPHVKKWGKTGANKLKSDVKKLKAKSKKMPVKTYNAEELAAYNANKEEE